MLYVLHPVVAHMRERVGERRAGLQCLSPLFLSRVIFDETTVCMKFCKLRTGRASYANAGGRVRPCWWARMSSFWRFDTPSLSKMLVR